MKTLFFFIALMSLGINAVEAGVYKWVDADGNIVYSQVPPPDASAAEEIRLPAEPGAPAEKTVKSPEKVEEGDKPDAETSVQKQLDPEQRKQYCEKARKNLQLLRSAGPDTAFVTEKNEIVRFNEEERSRRIRAAEKAADAYCAEEKD